MGAKAKARLIEAGQRGVFARIWEVVTRIPRGRVATYGQIARMTGLPGGARTVGWAMRALPDGVRVGGRTVPWHRVINARGRISPRRDARGGDGLARQSAALRREGIAVTPDGAIDLDGHLWRGERGRAPAPDRLPGPPARRRQAPR
jgi:methylated-DNA-protein-cysteine methyltransferase-like protein